jgi:hypothetical protein
MHGGASTGPRTLEGLARSRRANWKHGRYSAESREQRARLRLQAEYERAAADLEAYINQQLDDEAGSLPDFQEYAF